MKASYRNSLEAIPAAQESELEVDYLEACRLLEKLNFFQSQLWIDVPNAYTLQFDVESDGSLWVEITGSDFWAASEVNSEAGKEIIKIASEGGEFGDSIPVLNREWDASARI